MLLMVAGRCVSQSIVECLSGDFCTFDEPPDSAYGL